MACRRVVTYAHISSQHIYVLGENGFRVDDHKINLVYRQVRSDDDIQQHRRCLGNDRRQFLSTTSNVTCNEAR